MGVGERVVVVCMYIKGLVQTIQTNLHPLCNLTFSYIKVPNICGQFCFPLPSMLLAKLCLCMSLYTTIFVLLITFSRVYYTYSTGNPHNLNL